MQIASSTGASGAVGHCLALSETLARRGHDVTLLCLPGSWIARHVSPAVQVEFSDLHRVPLDEVRRVAALVRNRRIEVVHTHLSRGHFFGWLLGRTTGVAVVTTAHGRRLQPHWALSDRVIAVSEACAAFQRRWNLVRRSRLRTIANFVDLARFHPSTADERQAARERFGLTSGPVLAIVGHLGPSKRTHVALEACALVMRQQPAARLLIAGSGARRDMDRLRRQADACGMAGRIEWLGWRDDLAAILPGADVLVTASRDEACSLASAEAMACGVPVAAVPSPPVIELVGAGGIIAATGRAPALADAILSLLEDPTAHRRAAAAAIARITEHYNQDRQVALIEEALREAIAWRRSRTRQRVSAARVIDPLRTTHDPVRVAVYAAQMRGGITFPPIAVLPCFGWYIVADGHKRLSALRALQANEIDVRVWTLNDWLRDQWRQAAANARKWRQIARLAFVNPRESRRLMLTTVDHWRRVARSVVLWLRPRSLLKK